MWTAHPSDRTLTVMSRSPRNRADAFCARYNLQLPVLLAPMAGACPPRLSIAVANTGSMGAIYPVQRHA